MFDNDDDYLDSLKRDNSYYFSIPFSWDVRNEDGEWYTVSTSMDVDAEWDDYDHGYKVSYDCGDSDELERGGAVLSECFESLYDEVYAKFDSEGIPSDAVSMP